MIVFGSGARLIAFNCTMFFVLDLQGSMEKKYFT